MRINKTSSVALLTVLTAIASSSERASGNLIVNGGFETFELGTYVAWSTVNPTFSNPAPDYPHTGLYSAVFAKPQSAPMELYQSLSINAGSQYEISFWLLNANAVAGSNGFSVLWHGVSVFNQSPVHHLNEGYKFYSIEVTAPTNPIAELRFIGYDPGNAVVLDDVSVTLVPEPAAAASFMVAGLALLRRRRAC